MNPNNIRVHLDSLINELLYGRPTQDFCEFSKSQLRSKISSKCHKVIKGQRIFHFFLRITVDLFWIVMKIYISKTFSPGDVRSCHQIWNTLRSWKGIHIQFSSAVQYGCFAFTDQKICIVRPDIFLKKLLLLSRCRSWRYLRTGVIKMGIRVWRMPFYFEKYSYLLLTWDLGEYGQWTRIE